MKWRMVAVGKPALAYARLGIDDYLARIRRYTEVEMHWVKEGAGAQETGRRVLAQTADSHMVMLDERGKNLNTREMRAAITQMERQGVKRVAVVVGGANGHAGEVRAAAAETWSLGRLTMQHELALLVWLEQLYRQLTLAKGEPYHRD